jgi:SAM-dependent methyltransferase
MTSYQGRHAELYDLFYADKPYASEAAFVRARFEEAGVPPGREVLDVACGTGRHALALSAEGYQVVGIDHSEDMLTRARDRARISGYSIEFHCRDMRQIDLGGRLFDGAVCLFDSIGYVATSADIIQALTSIRDHLRPGGVFAAEYWHAAAMLRSYEPVRIRRWQTPGSDIERISETVLRPATQLAEVRYTIHEFHHDGTHASFSETQTNRYFLCEEMDQLLRTAGFAPQTRYAGFETGAAITEDTWHIVVVARRT